MRIYYTDCNIPGILTEGVITMKPDFASILGSLRHENKLSQKKAADGLGISQALLSHYENGVREPKLEFIVKACDYYGVSTDYILGRTTDRSFGGVAIRCRSKSDKRNADAAALIVSMLSEFGDDVLSEAAARYLNYSIYVILSALRAKKRPYEPLFDAAMKIAEAAFIENAHRAAGGAGRQRRLSDELLREKYPEQFEAMLQLEEIISSAVAHMSQNCLGDQSRPGGESRHDSAG